MKSIEECHNTRECEAKKIERVRQEDWAVLGLLGRIEWQDGSKESPFGLNAPLVAYLEEGFLTEDHERWYFFNADGALVKDIAKEKLARFCWGIGCIVSNKKMENHAGDFYIFEKICDDGKAEPFYVRANGEIFSPVLGNEDNRVYGIPADFLVDHGPFEDDFSGYYENNPKCMSLSEAKKEFVLYPPCLRENKPFAARR